MVPLPLIAPAVSLSASEDDEGGVYIYKFTQNDLDQITALTQAPQMEYPDDFSIVDGALAFTLNRSVVMISQKEKINSMLMLAFAAALDEAFFNHLPDIIDYALSALAEVDNEKEIAFREWLENYELPTVAMVA